MAKNNDAGTGDAAKRADVSNDHDTLEHAGATRRGYHHGDLRAHLIATVTDLVETQGPEGFSISEAARRASVSSAAPYKHFRDRDEILRAVATKAMEDLRDDMTAAASRYPEGSLEAVAAIGEAYVRFARTRPGVFRLAFGLTEGHEQDRCLMDTGHSCFAVVVNAVAACTDSAPDSERVQSASYFLWCFVHGHSFLTIDGKNDAATQPEADWGFLMSVAGAILKGNARAPGS
ncbi:MAG: TetR/AcrR family transcriptional regulator [Microvirga sp.]|nr:TetR/AcrR family transcriptional regulator [Microvirga sp.]